MAAPSTDAAADERTDDHPEQALVGVAAAPCLGHEDGGGGQHPERDEDGVGGQGEVEPQQVPHRRKHGRASHPGNLAGKGSKQAVRPGPVG